MKKVIAFLFIIGVGHLVNAQVTVTATEAKNHMGEIVSICDRIVDGRFLETAATKPTLLNVGGVYPDNIFTVVINFESRANFSFKPEEFYLNKRVCVTGKVVDFKGKPQIVVLSPAEIQVDERQETAAEVATVTHPVTKITVDSSVTENTKVVQNNTPSSSSLPVVEKTKVAEKVKPAVSEPTTKTAAKTEKESEATAPKEKTKDITPDNIYTVKLTNAVNLRSAASGTAEVVELIKAGSIVSILSSANGWSYVQHKRYSEEQKRDLEFKGYIKNSVLK